MINYLKENYYSVILHIIVVILAVQVYALSDKVKDLTGGGGPEAKRLQAGETFTYGNLTMYSGGSMIDTTKKTLVFAFTTKCPFCQQNIPLWNAIDSVGRTQKEYQAIGIWLDPDADMEVFREKYKPSFPIAFPQDKDLYKTGNNISAIPMSIVVGPENKVLKVILGKLDETGMADLRSVFLGSDEISKN